MSDEEISVFVDSAVDSMMTLVSEDNSDFSRFRNDQNKIYLKLLEVASADPGERSSLLKGTDQE